MGSSVIVPRLDLSKIGVWSGPAHHWNGPANNDGGGAAKTVASLADKLLISCSGSPCSVLPGSCSETNQINLGALFEQWDLQIFPELIKLALKNWFSGQGFMDQVSNASFDDESCQSDSDESCQSDSDGSCQGDNEKSVYLELTPEELKVCQEQLSAIEAALNDFFVPVLKKLNNWLGDTPIDCLSVITVKDVLNRSFEKLERLIMDFINNGNVAEIVGCMSDVKYCAAQLAKILQKPLCVVTLGNISANPLYSCDTYATVLSKQSGVESPETVGLGSGLAFSTFASSASDGSLEELSSSSAASTPRSIPSSALKDPAAEPTQNKSIVSAASSSSGSSVFQKIKYGLSPSNLARAFSAMCQQVGMRWHQMAVGERLRSLCKSALGLSPELLFAGSWGVSPVVVPRA